MYCLPELSGEGEASEGRKAVGHGRGVDVDGHGVAQAEVQVATMIVLGNRPGRDSRRWLPPLLLESHSHSHYYSRATQAMIEQEYPSNTFRRGPWSCWFKKETGSRYVVHLLAQQTVR